MKSQKLLLREYNGISSKKDIEEKNGVLYLSGVIQRADSKNANGRIYPRKVLDIAVGKYKKVIEEFRSAGELNHPSSIEVDLSRVCHYITDIWWVGDDLHGRLRITNNSIGRDVKALIEDGLKLGISSRGFGSVTKKSGDVIVNDDFELVCFDIVHDPSTAGAYVLKEGRFIKIENDDIQMTEEDNIYAPKKDIIIDIYENKNIDNILDNILKIKV
jgi:hypothetical protein